MNNEPNKSIEHYSIHNLICTHPDSSQFYQCTHTILKKPFTIRKIRHDFSSKQILTSIEIRKNYTERVYSKIKGQIELNRRIVRLGVAKYHKLLRTQRNFYLVYDQFPKLNLKQYIRQNVLTKQQKIELFKKIIKALQSIHQIGILIVSLTSETIRVDEDGAVYFTDLSQAIILQNTKIDKVVQFPQLYHQILPDQLIDFGRWGAFTDIYMLGKMFNKLINSSSIDSSQRYRRLLSIFSEMTQIQYQNRPSLQQVLQQLQKEINSKQRRISGTTDLKVDHLMIPVIAGSHRRKFSVGSFSNKSVSCQSERQSSIKNKSFEIETLNVDVKIQKSVQFKQIQLLRPSINSNLQIKSSKEVNRTILQPILVNTQKRIPMKPTRKVGKKLTETNTKVIQTRNLAFFLLDLSQFVMKEWIVPQLAFLLLKKANLMIQKCLEKIQLNQSSQFKQKQIYYMIFNEKIKIAMLLTKMREVFIHQQVQQQFKKELLDEQNVDEQYLQRKVRQLGYQSQIKIQKEHQNKIPLKQLAQKLFYTYMLLKKIEMNSYESFWNQNYNPKYAFLSQQKSINDQKRFGYDYLKRKVQNIVKHKQYV